MLRIDNVALIFSRVPMAAVSQDAFGGAEKVVKAFEKEIGGKEG